VLEQQKNICADAAAGWQCWGSSGAFVACRAARDKLRQSLQQHSSQDKGGNWKLQQHEAYLSGSGSGLSAVCQQLHRIANAGGVGLLPGHNGSACDG
jgi:hypothetical protein